MRYLITGLLGLFLASEAALAVSPPIGLSQNPRVGDSVTISTVCANAAAGGSVLFTFSQNGSSAMMPSIFNKTGANGFVNAIVGIPQSAQAGLGELIVTCPNGAVMSSVIAIDPVLPDGAIVKASDPTVYRIRGGLKYGIPSLSVFYRLGLSFGNLIYLSDSQLQSYPDGGVQN